MLYETLPVEYGDYTARLRLYLVDNMEFAPERKRPLILICPGGAYAWTSDREAEPVALQYMARGYHAAVLYYTCASAEFPTSLCQLAKSVALIRENAEKWGVDAEKIVVAGFSAGGHLALSLGTFWNSSFLQKLLAVKTEMIQPNGLILAYPVVTSGEFTHTDSMHNLLGKQYEKNGMQELVSLEHQVSEDMPPVFLWHTNEDTAVPAENSLLLAMELRRKKVPMELHIFLQGMHGLSVATKEVCGGVIGRGGPAHPEVQGWMDMSVNWIEEI